MMNLTFGEQVKIILGRKGMTIKELAEQIEKHTGKPMSRQNMTQRLGRDNFQEQDMRMIAKILGCNFTLEIKEVTEPVKETNNQRQEESVIPPVAKEQEKVEIAAAKEQEEPVLGQSITRDVTVGEFLEVLEEENSPQTEPVIEEVKAEKIEKTDSKEKEILRKGIAGYFMRKNKDTKKYEEKIPEKKEHQVTEILGEVNPYTGKEYETNSVRMHPKRIGYVQVYDQEQHMWTEMTEWAFLGYQERKKRLLGKNYKEPIYLD